VEPGRPQGDVPTDWIVYFFREAASFPEDVLKDGIHVSSELRENNRHDLREVGKRTFV